ncbi:50S ribosomal protein L40 [Burkholderia contaminans]|nr:50S ribosomal protein L40 [Burkholderia contaminans]
MKPRIIRDDIKCRASHQNPSDAQLFLHAARKGIRPR